MLRVAQHSRSRRACPERSRRDPASAWSSSAAVRRSHRTLYETPGERLAWLVPRPAQLGSFDSRPPRETRDARFAQDDRRVSSLAKKVTDSQRRLWSLPCLEWQTRNFVISI